MCIGCIFLLYQVTTFVSHTVAALILTPIIVDIARTTGQVQIVLMLSAFMMSGAMSLPMSSFPNANSLLVDDDFSRPFLHPMDFIKHGSVISAACFMSLCTVGYFLAYLFLQHDSGDVSPIKGAHHGM
jgi:phosphate transporter